MKPSLEQQREAVEWLLSVADEEGIVDESSRDVIRQACLSLGFLEKWQDVFKAVHHIVQAFPGSYLSEQEYDDRVED